MCSVPGCDRVARARGWCRLHYERWKRQGDPLVVLPRGGARVMPPRQRMVRPICQFDGCDHRSIRGGRGWCSKHYRRWYRHGDPSVVLTTHPHRKDVAETIHARVTIDDNGCWLWQGATLPNGYGVFGVGGQRYVHRASFEAFVGAIPDGHELHHRCCIRHCCNPAHLAAVTRKEHRSLHAELRAA